MYRGDPIYVLAAKAGEARLWRADAPASGLELVKEWRDPDCMAHEQELTTDLPGRAFDSAGHGRHAMEQEVSPKKEAAIRFASRVVEDIRKLAQSGCAKLYVAASPQFLGILRPHLERQIGDCERVEVAKDYSALDARELRGHLPEYL